MLAMLATAFFAYIIFVSNSSFQANQANQSRQNAVEGASQESLSLTVYKATGGTHPNWFYVEVLNAGGVPTTITALYVTSGAGSIITVSSSPSHSQYLVGQTDLSLNLPLTVPVRSNTHSMTSCGSSSGCDIGINPATLPSYAGGPILVNALTASGNVFSGAYPPNSASGTTSTSSATSTNISNGTTSTTTVTSTTSTYISCSNCFNTTVVGQGSPSLLLSLAACPSAGCGTTTFVFNRAGITLTATITDESGEQITGVQLFISPATGVTTGTAYVAPLGCTASLPSLSPGGSGQITCTYTAYTGSFGGSVTFVGYAMGTISGTQTTSSESTSNPVEIGNLVQSGPWSLDYFSYNYEALSQTTPANANYISAGYQDVAWSVSVNNNFNESMTILAESFIMNIRLGTDPIFFIVHGAPCYTGSCSASPTLSSYNCYQGVGSLSGCYTVAPGANQTIWFAACPPSSYNSPGTTVWEWYKSGGGNSGGTYCSPGGSHVNDNVAWSPVEGDAVAIVIVYTLGASTSGQIYSQTLPFQSEIITYSDSMSVVCSPGSVNLGSVPPTTTCTGTVTSSGGSVAPSGTLTFTASPARGSFGPLNGQCLLVASSGTKSSCSVTFAPSSAGPYVITASYPGDSQHGAVSGSTTVNAYATIAPAPASGPVGEPISLTGSHFVSSYPFGYCLSSSYTSLSCVSGSTGTFTSTSSGTVPSGISFAIPSMSPGSYYVVAYNGTAVDAYAAFTVSTATLSLSPISGPVGQPTTLAGSGYSPTTTYNDCISTSSTAVSCVSGSSGSFTSSSSGAIPGATTLTVPSGTSPGAYYVIAYIGSTVIQESTFTVTVPNLSVSPASGPVGQATTLSGSNYITSTAYSDCLSTSATATSCVSGSPSSFTSSSSGTIPSGTTVTVPSAAAAGPYYVIVYQASAVVSSAAFSVVTPTMSIAPASGPSGTMITLSGSNYITSTLYSDCLSTSSSATSSCLSASKSSFTTSSSGAIPSGTTVSVPSGTVAGTYYVLVYSGTTVVTQSTFTVTTASLSISPTQGPTGTTVTLTGSGYAPSTGYAFCFGSSSAACPGGTSTTFTSTSGGAIPSGTTISSPASGNAYVDVSQGTAGLNFITSKAFTATTPSITLTPAQGPKGISVSVSGLGFSISTKIGTFTFNGAAPVQTCTAQTTSASGAFSCTFTVPSSAAGIYTAVASGNDVGSVSGDTASTSFTITAPSILESPAQGPKGISVTVTGTGYTPGATITTFTFNGATPGTQTCTAKVVTAYGGFSCAYTVPTGSSAGAYTVVATGSDGGFDTDSDIFTVTTPAIVLSPTSGGAGTSVTVTGSGFTPGVAITTFTYNGAAPGTQTCTSQVVGTGGGFSCSFTVPSGVGGSHSAVATGSDGGSDTASKAFSLTPTLNISPTSHSHLSSATVTLLTTSTGFSASTAYSYCLSTSSTSVSCLSGTTGSFTSTTSGGIPSGKTLTVASGTSAGTYYVIVYSVSTVVASATYTET